MTEGDDMTWTPSTSYALGDVVHRTEIISHRRWYWPFRKQTWTEEVDYVAVDHNGMLLEVVGNERPWPLRPL